MSEDPSQPLSRVTDPRTAPLAREAHLEWAHRAAAGRLPGLLWVELNPDPAAKAYRARRTRRGLLYFRQSRIGRTLPPPMLQQIAQAEVRGGATLLQAMTLAFATPEWLLRTRGLLWTELTPVPSLLVDLIEAYGISPEIHRAEEGRLLRLRARLPAWHKRRGAVDEAVRLLTDAVGQRPEESLSAADSDGSSNTDPAPFPTADDPRGRGESRAAPSTEEFPGDAEDSEDEVTDPGANPSPGPQDDAAPAETALATTTPVHGLESEVLACRDLQWYRRRMPRGAPATQDLRIHSGLVHYQPRNSKPFRLIREDIRVGWTPGTPLSPLAPRLLPPWACYRIVVEGAEQS